MSGTMTSQKTSSLRLDYGYHIGRFDKVPIRSLLLARQCTFLNGLPAFAMYHQRSPLE